MIIAAISLAVATAAPAISGEATAPFEQNQLDRVLPIIELHIDAPAQNYEFVVPAP